MKGTSELSVADAVDETLKELETKYPDVKLTKIDDAVAYTRGNYVAAMEALIEGAALAVLVVLLFLRNMRATLISAIALPLAAIPTFWAMSAFGFSLNLVSLLGITLATGILVDDAIVEIENIVRHMHMGKSPYRAALEAADEIGLAVIAITLTIVAIFAPVSFMGGIAGQYFKQFGMTVAVAVLFSLLVARLITPMMAAYLMRPIPEKAHVDGALMRFYTRFLAATLRWRYATLVSGVALFSAAIYATTLLPTGFLPDEDTSRVVVSVELPPGTQLGRHPEQDGPDGEVAAGHTRSLAGLRAWRHEPDRTTRGPARRALRQARAEDGQKADAEAAENHHRCEAFRHSGQPRLVRERAWRARAVVLDAVAQRRRFERRNRQGRGRLASGSGLPQRCRGGFDRTARNPRRAAPR